MFMNQGHISGLYLVIMIVHISKLYLSLLGITNSYSSEIHECPLISDDMHN